MSYNSSEALAILRIVKKAAVDAVRAMKPMAHIIGIVEKESPLTVRINQKIVLTKEHLLLTDIVRDRIVAVSNADDQTQSKKQYTVHGALKAGERILLLRCEGGQKYIILTRMEETA